MSPTLPLPRKMAATVTTSEGSAADDGGDDCHGDEEQEEAHYNKDNCYKNFVIMIIVMLRITVIIV